MVNLLLSGISVNLVGPGAVLFFIALLAFPDVIDDIDDPIGVRQFSPRSLRDSYDFIVVGGGSTGCVVAGRLASALPDKSVLLLEAGSDGTLLTDIPTANPLIFDSSYDWDYSTEPDGQSCLGMKGLSCLWHRGKILGGTSAINGMIYIRGHPEEFNEWARHGNYGWSYEDVLPFFRRSQDQQDPFLAKDVKHHGVGGPQPVSFPPYQSQVSEAFLEAAHQFGFDLVRDLNGKALRQSSFAFMQGLMKDGSRYSSAKSYLQPVLHQPNLHVLTRAHVLKLLVDNNRAHGVLVDWKGKARRIWCNHEIVLSAGVIATPQLLMLSGIGPKEHLESLGIKVNVDLPVGYNVQSHITTQELIFTLTTPGVAVNPTKVLSDPRNILQYAFEQRGPLSSASFFEGNGLIWSGLTNETYPDVMFQLFSTHIAFTQLANAQTLFGYTDQQFSRISELEGREGFSIYPILLRPKSKGRIMLRNQSPYEKPIIHANYFQDPDDLRTMIKALRIAVALGQMPALKKYGSNLWAKPNPSCLHINDRFSDEYWECVLRHNTISVYHDVGSCKMGPFHDSWAVVDPELRVYGVSNLRVSDASVFPTATSGGPMATLLMVGEKTAHMIIESIKRDVK